MHKWYSERLGCGDKGKIHPGKSPRQKTGNNNRWSAVINETTQRVDG